MRGAPPALTPPRNGSGAAPHPRRRPCRGLARSGSRPHSLGHGGGGGGRVAGGASRGWGYGSCPAGPQPRGRGGAARGAPIGSPGKPRLPPMGRRWGRPAPLKGQRGAVRSPTTAFYSFHLQDSSPVNAAVETSSARGSPVSVCHRGVLEFGQKKI